MAVSRRRLSRNRPGQLAEGHHEVGNLPRATADRQLLALRHLTQFPHVAEHSDRPRRIHRLQQAERGHDQWRRRVVGVVNQLRAIGAGDDEEAHLDPGVRETEEHVGQVHARGMPDRDSRQGQLDRVAADQSGTLTRLESSRRWSQNQVPAKPSDSTSVARTSLSGSSP